MRALAPTTRRGASILLAGAVLAGTAVATAAPALAQTTGNGGVVVGWQPDANDLGTLTFYDAAGHQVTSGKTTDAPMAAYYVSSAKTGTGAATSGQVQTTTPVNGTNSGAWPGTQNYGSAIAFPVSNLPGDLAGFTGAVVKGAASDGSFQVQQISTFPNNDTSTTDGYGNLYEVRMIVNGVTSKWYAADIKVDSAAGTWTQVFPNQTAPTVQLSSSDANPAPAGTTSANVTATLSTTAPGSVQFYDGSTALGSPVAVSGTTATASVSGLHDGGNQLTARYIPTPGSTWLGATSSILTFCVGSTCTTPPAAVTNLTAKAASGALDLSWTPPANGGGAIDHYVVTYTRSGGSTGTVQTPDASSSYVLTGLTNGATYTVSIQAHNSAGLGAASNTATGRPVGVPDAPFSASATAQNGSAVVSFYAGQNNGSAVTSYTVTASTGETASGTSSPITVPVANGTSRTFTVTATNGVGTSRPSAPSNAVAFYGSVLTIRPSAGTVVAGTLVQLVGQLSSGPAEARQIRLLTYPAGHPATSTTLTTSSTGDWSVLVRPVFTTSYQVVYDGDATHAAVTSVLTRVSARAKVAITSPRNGTRTRTRKLAVTGRTFPNKAGALVYLYEYRGKTKVKLATARVGRAGTFRFVRTFARGKHVLVAVVGTTATNLAGTSPRVTLYEL